MPTPTTPTFCYVSGWLYDKDSPIGSQPIYVKPKTSFMNSEIFISHSWKLFATTQEDGYFAARIYESETANVYWQFKIGNNIYETIIPNETSVLWNDLTLRTT